MPIRQRASEKETVHSSTKTKTTNEKTREKEFLNSLTPLDPKRKALIQNHIAKYNTADDAMAYKILALHTFLWMCLYPLYNYIYAPLFILIKGAMVVRSFILFHDMTHGSYFTTTKQNKFYGEFCALMCLTPFADWGKNHKGHHDMFGDLSIEKFDGGNTTWFTKQWVDAWPFWKRWGFYLIRDPILVYFWLVPLQWGLAFHFRSGGLTTSLAFFGTLYAHYSVYGYIGMIHEILSLCLGAGFGIYLFHLQHSVNPAYRVHLHVNHDKVLGGLYGSTFLVLHPFIKFFTLGIEYHHIHHVSTRVPCYKIQACHEEAPPGLFSGVVHVDTFEKYVVSSFHTLWDDETQSLVTFPWYQKMLSLCGFNEPKMWGRQHMTTTKE